MQRRNRNFTVFNMSAIDLFASAMGAFMVVAVVLMPYFMKVSKAESRLQVAREMLEEAQRRESESRQRAQAVMARAGKAEKEAADTEGKRDDLRQRRAEAQAGGANAADSREQCEAQVADLEIKDIDLVVAIDTTASMGPDIEALREEIAGIARILDRIATSVRIGVIAFRDDDATASPYVTLAQPLIAVDAAGIMTLERFLQGLDVVGGMSCPEDVHAALAVARGFGWRSGAQHHVVVVSDAGGDAALAFRHARAFAAAGGRVSTSFRPHPSTACSDLAAPQAFLAQLAREGGGRTGGAEETLTEAVLLSVLGK